MTNPRTYKRGVGKEGGEGAEAFFSFFQEYETSAPDVFSSCSFIPRPRFELRLVIVSNYGYERWRLNYQIVKPFMNKNACFFTFFDNKSESLWMKWLRVLIYMLFYTSTTKEKKNIYRGFNLILGKIQVVGQDEPIKTWKKHVSWNERWNDCDQGIVLNSDWERKWGEIS